MSSTLLYYNSMAIMCSQQRDGAVKTSCCSSKSRENDEGIFTRVLTRVMTRVLIRVLVRILVRVLSMVMRMVCQKVYIDKGI